MRTIFAFLAIMLLPTLALAQGEVDPQPILDQAVSAFQSGAIAMGIGFSLALVLALLGKYDLLKFIPAGAQGVVKMILPVVAAVSSGLIAGAPVPTLILSAVTVLLSAAGLAKMLPAKK